MFDLEAGIPPKLLLPHQQVEIVIPTFREVVNIKEQRHLA